MGCLFKDHALVIHWHTAGVQQGELMTSTRRISERGKVQKGKSKKRIGKSEINIEVKMKITQHLIVKLTNHLFF